jgi:hypothetical protein
MFPNGGDYWGLTRSGTFPLALASVINQSTVKAPFIRRRNLSERFRPTPLFLLAAQTRHSCTCTTGHSTAYRTERGLDR